MRKLRMFTLGLLLIAPCALAKDGKEKPKRSDSPRSYQVIRRHNRARPQDINQLPPGQRKKLMRGRRLGPGQERKLTGSLPPGQQKQLERKGQLPPGQEKKH